MKNLLKGLCAVVACALGMVAGADEDARTTASTLTYDVNGSGAWTEATRWQERLAPIAGDTLVVTGRALLADADAAAVVNAAKVTVATNSTLVVSNDAEIAMAGYVDGSGSLVKLGTGCLNYGSLPASSKSRELITGGTVISNGLVNYPAVVSAGIDVYPGPMAVWAPGALGVSPLANFHPRNIAGDGIITNTAAASSNMRTQLWFEGTGVWDGLLTANLLRVYAPGDMTYTNPGSTIDHAEFCTYGGVAAFTSFGRLNAPSTSGKATVIKGRDYGGTIRYVGNVDEETNKSFNWSHTAGQSGTFDAGAHGGLTITGEFSATMPNMWLHVYLTGSNAVPCVLKGIIQDDSLGSTTFTKTGTGTWYLADTTARRTQKGLYELQQGTLRFDSVANIGTTCSFGLQTCCVALTNAIGNVNATAGCEFLSTAADGEVPVLEYTGLGEGATDRRIGLAGSLRLRNLSSTQPLLWHGGAFAYPQAVAGRTLILEGADGVTNRIDNLEDRGEHTFDLVVDGGSWALGTNITFSGNITVKRGELLAAPPKTRYTWYKWFIRENGNGRTRRLGGTATDTNVGAKQFAFYDADGNNIGRGVFAETAYSNLATLQPGQMTYTMKVTKYSAGNTTPAAEDASDYGRNLNRLFDGQATEWLVLPSMNPTRLDYTNNWFGVVFRFPDSSPAVAGYDIWAYGGGRGVCDWQLLGSVDGAKWEVLDERAVATGASNWLSGSSAGIGATTCTLAEGNAFVLAKTAPEDPVANYGLPNVGIVTVAEGASFRGRTDVPQLFPATLAVTNGVDLGTWENFAVPATGAIDIRMTYDWFRVTVTETYGGMCCRDKGQTPVDGNVQMHEMAVYDADGKRLNLGLQMAQAGTQASLAPGYACYERTDVNEYTTRRLSQLFDGVATGTGWCATWTGAPARMDIPASQCTFVFRLPAGQKTLATSLDWVPYNGNEAFRDLRGWQVQVSWDGQTWVKVMDRMLDEGSSGAWHTKGGCWYSDGKSFVAGAVRTGYPFENVSELMGKMALRDFTCTLGLVDCTGAANFRNWTVSVNGVVRPNARLVYHNGRLVAVLPGSCFLLL